jgi:hypothetical protein
MTHPTTTIDLHELNRLRECEKAWQAVYMALQTSTGGVFSGPRAEGLNGIDCAVQEIKRLQGVSK